MITRLTIVIALLLVALLVAFKLFTPAPPVSTRSVSATRNEAREGAKLDAVALDRAEKLAVRGKRDSTVTAVSRERYHEARAGIPPLPAPATDTALVEAIIAERDSLRSVVLAYSIAIVRADTALAAADRENITLRLEIGALRTATGAKERELVALNAEVAAAIGEAHAQYLSGMKTGLVVGAVIGAIAGGVR